MATDAHGTSTGTTRAPDWLREAVTRIEQDDRWDPVAESMEEVATPLAEGGAGPLLRGEWMGHALHPMLTDVPIGCWQASMLLDVVGGRRSRSASRRLVGLGVLSALPTAAAGLVELPRLRDPRARRVAAAHAAGNTVALALYAASFRARRRHHLRGVLLGLAGGSVASVTGFLGGHLSFARGAGVEDRGIGDPTTIDVRSTTMETGTTGSGEVRGSGERDLIGVEDAARQLTMPVEQVHALVDQGVLSAARTDPLGFLPEDVEAVRLMGG